MAQKLVIGGIITTDTQVQADWNATSGVAQILNKPTISGSTPNIGAYSIAFDGGADDLSTPGFGFFGYWGRAETPWLFTYGQETDLTRKCISFARASVIPNSSTMGYSVIYAKIRLWINNTFNHYFKAKCTFPALANSQIRGLIGYTNNTISVGPALTTNGVYFRANSGVNSGNFQCVAVKNGVETSVNTAVVAVSSSYRTFEIRVLLSIATFYIDDVLVGTISTNLPNTSSNLIQPVVGLTKSIINSGTTNDIIDIGWISHYYTAN